MERQQTLIYNLKINLFCLLLKLLLQLTSSKNHKNNTVLTQVAQWIQETIRYVNLRHGSMLTSISVTILQWKWYEQSKILIENVDFLFYWKLYKLNFNPFTTKISLVILLTICQMILILSVWRIWYWIN